MTAAKKLRWISIEDYLTGELASTVKHEYLGGLVYAMAGGTNAHNLLASNCLVAVGSRLRGKRCRAYNSDTKIRISSPTHSPSQVRFYYPDLSVICHPNSPRDSFQDEPTLVIEVLSRSTRRIDLGEKKDAYLSIPSLAVYLLVEQESALVMAYRRAGEEFVREDYDGMEAVVPLPEIEAVLPLHDIYDGVELVPEPEPSE
jgi:Uma2 family endonuclease